MRNVLGLAVISIAATVAGCRPASPTGEAKELESTADPVPAEVGRPSRAVAYANESHALFLTDRTENGDVIGRLEITGSEFRDRPMRHEFPPDVADSVTVDGFGVVTVTDASRLRERVVDAAGLLETDAELRTGARSCDSTRVTFLLENDPDDWADLVRRRIDDRADFRRSRLENRIAHERSRPYGSREARWAATEEHIEARRLELNRHHHDFHEWTLAKAVIDAEMADSLGRAHRYAQFYGRLLRDSGGNLASD